jgi:D-xylose transport system substrate-binding protein
MGPKAVLALVSFALSIATGLVLSRGNAPESAESAAASSTNKARPVQIGLSLDTLKEARWGRDRDAFQARAKELGAEVTVLSANSDDNRQVMDVTSLITRQVDVLVVVPHDGKAMAKAVSLAHAANIPVIAYDRLIQDSDVDLYVTFDNVRVGGLQATFLLDRFPARSTDKPLRLVRIYGSKTDNNAFMFKQGQDEALKSAIESGKVVVLHEDWAEDWKPENAKRIMNAALTKNGHTIDAVLASNDGTAGGAIQALLEEGLAGKVPVTGQDAELVACQRIVRGEQAMTIYKPVEQLARKATELAVSLARGRPLVARASTPNGKVDVPSVLADVITVTRDNLDATVIADNFHSRDAVYGKVTP